MLKPVLTALVALIPTVALADPPAPRVVDVSAPDGAMLKATYYAAGAPGPAVLLLHMCNTIDSPGIRWGVNSARPAFMRWRSITAVTAKAPATDSTELTPQERQKLVNEKWAGDIDAAYTFLVSQDGRGQDAVSAPAAAAAA